MVVSVKDFVSVFSDFQLDTGVALELALDAFRAKADFPPPCRTLWVLVCEDDLEPEVPDLTVVDEPFEPPVLAPPDFDVCELPCPPPCPP